jgi:hypothetical protein
MTNARRIVRSESREARVVGKSIITFGAVSEPRAAASADGTSYSPLYDISSIAGLLAGRAYPHMTLRPFN